MEDFSEIEETEPATPLDKIINTYVNGFINEQPSYTEGQELLELLFDQTDNIIIKPDKTAKSERSFVSQIQSVPFPQIGKFDSSVFLLNPIKTSIAEILREKQYAHLGIGVIEKFQNLRFEWDDDGDGNKIAKKEQLRFIRDSGLPITALLDTGNKSIHVLINIKDITSLEEYRLIAISILARLPGFPDYMAVEPCQPIWLPGGRRLNDNNEEVYPRLIFSGQKYSKKEIYQWIRWTPIRSPELLTHLKDPPGVYVQEYESTNQSEDYFRKKVVEMGGEILKQDSKGWSAICPFCNYKRRPTAFVFRNGYVSCRRSSCTSGWIVKYQDKVTKNKSDFQKSDPDLKHYFEMGYSYDEYKTLLENKKYFEKPAKLDDLLKEGRKILSQLGTESSTMFMLRFETMNECLSVYTRLGSLNQSCFYGRDTDDNPIAICLFSKAIETPKFVNFINGLHSFGFAPKIPLVSPVEDLNQVKDYRICIFKNTWGYTPTIDDIKSLIEIDGTFWVSHFLPPKDSFPNRTPKFQRLKSLVPANAKKLSDQIIKKFGQSQSSVEKFTEPPKSEILSSMHSGEEITYDWLASAGVSISYLNERGFQVDKSTRKNLVNLPRFWELLGLQESRKKPIITDSSTDHTDDRNRDLLYYIKDQLDRKKSEYFCIVAPAGFGKTTFLQQYLPKNLGQLGLYSALIARERVLDVIEGEGKANEWESPFSINQIDPNLTKLEKITHIQSNRPERRLKIGKDSFEVITYTEPHDETPEDHQSAEQWIVEQRIIEENLELAKPATAFAIVSYKEEICLKEGKGPLEEVNPDFCNSKCPHTSCRAHFKHRKAALNQRFVISSHEAATQSSGFNRISIGGNQRRPRDLIVFDEKPTGVFEEYSIAINNDTIDFIDSIIAAIPEEKRKLKKEIFGSELMFGEKKFADSLDEILNKIKNDLLKHLSDTRIRLKQLKGTKDADSYLRLCHKDYLFRLADKTLSNALYAAASGQPTKKSQNDIRQLAATCESLNNYDGEMIETYLAKTKVQKSDSLTIKWGGPKWSHLRTSWTNKCIIMDATAHLDPDYSMPGAPDLIRIPKEQQFPNMTIHCTSDKDISAKKFVDDWDKKYEESLLSLVKHIKEKFQNEKILLVTKKEMREKVLKTFKSSSLVSVDHFGNLKGSNEYRDHKHIIFTNFLRWNTDSYLLRAMYLNDGSASNVLTQKLTPIMKGNTGIMISRGKFSNGAEFRNQELEMLRLQYETPDMIQTIMRTALRDDMKSEVHVWLPGKNPRKIGMLMDYFVGAKVDLFNK